jgi:hypothetical protein
MNFTKLLSILVTISIGLLTNLIYTLVTGNRPELEGLKQYAIYLGLAFCTIFFILFLINQIRMMRRSWLRDTANMQRRNKAIYMKMLSKSEQFSNYFFEQAFSLLVKGRFNNQEIGVWDVTQLTQFERDIPSDAVVLIDRPLGLSQGIIPAIDEVIKENCLRGVQYFIIGGVPPSLSSINGVSPHLIANHNSLTANSLLLPYIGVVVYLLKSISHLNADEQRLWYEVHRPSYSETPVSEKKYVRGFITIPFASAGSEYSHFAVPLRKPDVDLVISKMFGFSI